jgi:hypothetical protein
MEPHVQRWGSKCPFCPKKCPKIHLIMSSTDEIDGQPAIHSPQALTCGPGMPPLPSPPLPPPHPHAHLFLLQAAAAQIPRHDELLQAARELAELSQARAPQEEIENKTNQLATSSAAAAQNTVFQDINDGSFRGYTLSVSQHLHHHQCNLDVPQDTGSVIFTITMLSDIKYTALMLMMHLPPCILASTARSPHHHHACSNSSQWPILPL